MTEESNSELLLSENIIKESFAQYAGAVIQSRSVVDVRDCVKPSARQVFYAMYTDKFVADKPFKKTLKAIGSAMRFYIHGDSSCEGIIMRAGQPFALRYPLVEVEGSYGTVQETGNWAASRYTSARLSSIADYLIQDTTKDTIDEWIDNYDDTEQYPRVLSSLGFYNIVNGSFGIAVGLATSIPQFNLKETNDALITLLKNPDASFNDIYCAPDFATGGIIINKDEVKESMRLGKGKACVIRAKIDYSKKDNALVVTELPYGVYTNTICNEIAKIAASDENPGIININDLTGENVNIKIYLSKSANPAAVKEYLYDKTKLQSSYSINMTMLENGRYPKIYGWREALLEHLEHEKLVYINVYTCELNKLNKRLNIVNGIIQALNNLDETIEIIQNSKSTADASSNLQLTLGVNEDQAKAILDIKLSRLARLEVNKLLDEKQKLETRIAEIEAILASEELLKEQMIIKFQEVSQKFSDARRTEITYVEVVKKPSTTSKAAKTKAVPQDIIITMNSLGYLKAIPVSNYRKAKDCVNAVKTKSDDMVILFSNIGKAYRVKASSIGVCGTSDKGTAAGSLLELSTGEKITNFATVTTVADNNYIMVATKNGMVKRAQIRVYAGSTANVKGISMINLKNGDSVLDIKLYDEPNYIILSTKNGYNIQFETEEITSQGRTTNGLKGITLGDGDSVIKFEIGYNKLLPVQKRAGRGKQVKEK